jgi:cyclopropane fatty-acyl-phospholipid synthase-like methyltransferase
VSDPRTRIVAEGYDAIGERFVEWRDRIVGDDRDRWRTELTSRLAPGARILELGCGDGTPDARILDAEGFAVTGVDISAQQVARARANVPRAGFVQSDFTELELDSGSFDAVAAFYSFNNVPRDLLAPLFARIHAWLVPGGLFLATFGTSDTEEWVGEWLGAKMFFSSFPPDKTRRLLRAAGFELLLDERMRMVEPEPEPDEGVWQWVLARS